MSVNEHFQDSASAQKSIDVNDSKDNSSQDALPAAHQHQQSTPNQQTLYQSDSQSAHNTNSYMSTTRPASAILSPPDVGRQLSHITNSQQSLYEVGHTSLQGVRPSMEDEVCIEQSFTIGDSHKYSFYAVFDVSSMLDVHRRFLYQQLF